MHLYISRRRVAGLSSTSTCITHRLSPLLRAYHVFASTRSTLGVHCLLGHDVLQLPVLFFQSRSLLASLTSNPPNFDSPPVKHARVSVPRTARPSPLPPLTPSECDHLFFAESTLAHSFSFLAGGPATLIGEVTFPLAYFREQVSWILLAALCDEQCLKDL